MAKIYVSNDIAYEKLAMKYKELFQMLLLELYYRKVLKKDPPYYAKYSSITILWKPVRKFINVVIIPNIPFNIIRIWLYRLIGFKIGKNVFIGMKCYLDDVDPSKMIIEDNVVISYGCYFACHGIGQTHTPIYIKSRAYLGMRCTVISGKKGITIGESAIVGAASLVNKDIPPHVIAFGVPVKIKERKNE